MKAIIDLCMKQPEGKYVLVKDPNKVRSGSTLSSIHLPENHPVLDNRADPFRGDTLTFLSSHLYSTEITQLTYSSVLTAGHPLVFRSR